MEQFVLGIFQEQLAKFLVGFKKEQVNANLLNGKGEIRDVNLNCSFVNDLLCKVTPHIMLEEIRVSKLGFNVTNWTNLKKAPIVVDVEDVFVTIVEPLTYTEEKDLLRMEQLSFTEFKERMKDQKPRGSYNLFDRILDNLQIEIRSVHISFQPRGRFKTQREGPWTPPRLLMTLRHLKYCSVNEFGNEATPEDCWKHNRFIGHPRNQTLLVYKKASMQVTLAFQKIGETDKSPPLMKDAHVDVYLTFHKAFINSAILSLQLDAIMNQIEITLNNETIPVLAHAVAGMQYCFSKNRAFEDPLSERGGNTNGIATNQSLEVVASESLLPITSEVDDDTDDEQIGELDEGDQGLINGEHGDIDEGSFDEEDSKSQEGSSSVKPASPVKRKSKQHPVIILPSGITIHRKISMSLSIRDCKVRGHYCGGGGYIQLQAKGLVAEMIWPKVTREKGCYVQMSLAYLNIQENFNNKVTTLLRGGIHHDVGSGPVEGSAKKRAEIRGDESFPMFEDRCIRPDPLDLRHAFPAQALGVKATLSVVDKFFAPHQEEIMVLNEIGIDRFEIILESEPWCRTIRFAMNESGGGFDPRWNSGDWTDVLTKDMLHHPSQPLNLAEHLQQSQKVPLGENDFISSDLFNVTARISNIIVKVPAAVQRDVQSCDIVLHLPEIMAIVSSALPRTFLTGKIGSAVCVHGSAKDSAPQIDFPNDPSDICFELQAAEDPLMQQQGKQTTKKLSTFRAQLTIKGLSLKLLPIIPFCDAEASKELLAPLDVTMIFCFEGEVPAIPDTDRIKMIAFQSMQISEIDVNCDFDMITGAVSSILYHTGVVGETVATVEKLAGIGSTVPDNEASSSSLAADDSDTQIFSRNVLLAKQYERSKTSDGLSCEVSIQVASVGLHIWRQNAPLNSRFRASVTGDHKDIDASPIPVVKLLSVSVKGIEVGMEAALQQKHRRMILKACVSELKVQACDFDKASAKHVQFVQDQADARARELDRPQAEAAIVDINAPEKSNERIKGVIDPQFDMVSLIGIGGEPGKDIMVRLEERREEQTAVSVAMDMDVGGVVSLHVHEIEMFFLLLIEALLLPTNVQPPARNVNVDSGVQFPEGSIGALFAGLFSTASPTQKKEASSSENNIKKVVDNSSTLDQWMHNLVLSFLPDSTGECLLRFILGNVFIFVPHHSANGSEEASGPTPWLGHELREASILSAYLGLTSADSRAGLVQRLGKKGCTWASFFSDDKSGFHHSIKTSQGLHSAELVDSRVVLRDALIDSFDVGLTYNPEGIDLLVGDSTLSVLDLDNMRRLRSSLIAFVDRIGLTRRRIESVTFALSRKTVAIEDEINRKAPRVNEYIGDGSGIVDDADLSLQQGRALLERLKILIEIHDADMKSAIKNKQHEINKLQLQVFLKERGRVAALALVSCQAAGWLRIGGMHMTGARSPTTASMWRYHAVLRKSLLIMYAGPGKPRPLDVISLQGACLLTLAGGRRMRDIKNGFAIRERSGCVRYVFAPNGPELEVWIHELRKTIKIYSDQGDLIEDEDTFEAGDDTLIDGVTGDSMRSRARTLSSEAEVTRMRTMSNDVDGVDEDFTFGSTQKTKKSSQIRKRLSKVTASTKSTIGSAVQAAKERRQRGDDMGTNDADSVERDEGESLPTTCSAVIDPEAASSVPDEYSVPLNITTNNDVTSGGSEFVGLSQQSEGNMPSSDVTSAPKFAGLRSNAKNRFGSAMQGAKEKALAVAEERRRKKEMIGVIVSEGDKPGARKGFGLRSRLENVAANVKNKTDKNNVTSLSESTQEEEVAEHPSAATTQLSNLQAPTTEFSNGELAVTEVRGVVPDESQQTDVSEDVHQAEIDDFDVEGDDDDEIDRQSGSIRTKLTKLGAAVKSKRQEKQVARAASGGPGDQDKSSRFSIRRKQTNRLPEESDLLKLKAVRLAGGYQSFEDGNDLGADEAPPMARIKGSWIVHVQSRSDSSTKQEASDGALKEPAQTGNIPANNASKPSSSEKGAILCEDSEMMSGSDDREVQMAKVEQLRYSVRIVSQDPEKQGKMIVTTVNRDFLDVVGLFIDVLECISSVPQNKSSKAIEENRDAAVEMSESLASSLGIAPIDIVKLTGELLGGLLSGSSYFQSIAAYHEYQCEVLTEFLNSCLTCPMPIVGCMSILEFLEIDAGVMPVLEGNTEGEISVSSTLESAKQETPVDRTREIMALTSACLTHLLRAEASGILVQHLGVPKSAELPTYRKAAIFPLKNPYLEPLLPSTVSNGLRDAMHEALRTVMTERDEAQAQLIATSVQHVHEMESERKYVELTKKKLLVAEDQAKRQQGLFAERFKDPKVRSAEDLQKYLEEMVKSSDKEIQGLCKQLAKEVTEKTASKLEIMRLKDSMKLERETDAAEKRALEEALMKAREQLAEANLKMHAAEALSNRSTEVEEATSSSL